MNFNELIDRRGTFSYKWDQRKQLFGGDDVLPLWVADMDFQCSPAIVEALVARASHGIYGYTIKSQEYLDAITGWFQDRHHWTIEPAWLTDSPGVVPSLSMAVRTLTAPGDQVIVMSPVYNPFYDVIVKNGRTIADSPLVLRDGRYEMNFAALEEHMRAGARLLLLCSPHNPGGRVWSKEELLQLGELCIQYDVQVVADEIHCDLVFDGNKHHPFASLSSALAERTVTCLAPSKTFNIPGLQTSFVAISNPGLKRLFDAEISALSMGSINFFGPTATIAAYTQGKPWLESVLSYVKENHDYAIQYLGEHLPRLIPIPSEGTYLLWVDCRALGLAPAALKRFMYRDAKIAFNEGSIYGKAGEGFLRINLACPRDVLTEALTRFAQAVERIGS